MPSVSTDGPLYNLQPQLLLPTTAASLTGRSLTCYFASLKKENTDSLQVDNNNQFPKNTREHTPESRKSMCNLLVPLLAFFSISGMEDSH